MRTSVTEMEMVFLRKAKVFACDESGAVTVDWVVLTSAIVLLAVAVVSTVETGLYDNASDASNAIVDATSFITPLTVT